MRNIILTCLINTCLVANGSFATIICGYIYDSQQQPMKYSTHGEGPNIVLNDRPEWTRPDDQGYYSFQDLTVPGVYALFAHHHRFHPAYVPNIHLTAGPRSTQVDLNFTADYYVITTQKEYTWSNTITQSFVAQSHFITKAGFLSGGEKTETRFRILDASTNTPIGPPRYGNTDLPDIFMTTTTWVYGEVPVQPGKLYKLELFAPGLVVYYDPSGSYPNGSLNIGPSGVDIIGYIAGDNNNDGIRTDYNLNSNGSHAYQYCSNAGTTFIANGSCVVAAGVFTSGTEELEEYTAHFRIKEGGPNGSQIGPKGAANHHGAGLYSAVWKPGEVPVLQGQTYYLQIFRLDGQGIVASLCAMHDFDAMGTTYLNDVLQENGHHLAAEILTYSAPVTPTPISIPVIKGDANCDGLITPGDALLTFQFYLQSVIPAMTPCNQFASADFDDSGNITPGDALCIFRMYLQNPC